MPVLIRGSPVCVSVATKLALTLLTDRLVTSMIAAFTAVNGANNKESVNNRFSVCDVSRFNIFYSSMNTG